MNKILVGLTVAALLATAVVPALAEYIPYDQYNKNNCAFVSNEQTVIAKTGDNGIANSTAFGGESSLTQNNDGNMILTGSVYASLKAASIVNSNVNDCCGEDTDTQKVKYDMAFVTNRQKVFAETGDNGIAESKACGGESTAINNGGAGEMEANIIQTGHVYARVKAFNLVNSNVLRGVVMPAD